MTKRNRTGLTKQTLQLNLQKQKALQLFTELYDCLLCETCTQGEGEQEPGNQKNLCNAACSEYSGKVI